MVIKEIVNKLKAIRVINKITHEDLTKLTGISQKHISNIENHKAVPTIETLQKLARGLGVDIDLKISDSHQQASGQ